MYVFGILKSFPMQRHLWMGKQEHEHDGISQPFQAEIALPPERAHTASRQLFAAILGEP